MQSNNIIIKLHTIKPPPLPFVVIGLCFSTMLQLNRDLIESMLLMKPIDAKSKMNVLIITSRSHSHLAVLVLSSVVSFGKKNKIRKKWKTHPQSRGSSVSVSMETH